jgi:hypothetical protein
LEPEVTDVQKAPGPEHTPQFLEHGTLALVGRHAGQHREQENRVHRPICKIEVRRVDESLTCNLWKPPACRGDHAWRRIHPDQVAIATAMEASSTRP